MKYNGVIQRKLALLDDQIENLRTHLAGVSEDEFCESWLLRSMTERALQVSVEIMVDIAERIIAMEGAGPVESAAKAMERLASLKILTSAMPYADMVRLRNLIVREYEHIDPRILFHLATERLDDFRRFRDELDGE